DARLTVVETGKTGEIRTTGGKEGFAAADRELLERLKTVGGKAGGDDCDPGHPPPGKPGQHPVGGRLEPFGAAEARLKGDIQFAAERRAEQRRRPLAVIMIGITQLA